MKSILKCICILFLLFPITFFAQEIKTIRDIGVWSSVGLDYKINKKWKFSTSHGIRTFNNAISIDKSITDFGIEYKINKQFKLEGGLRYAYNREKDNIFSHNIRYNTDFKFKTKIAKNFDLLYRFRFQSNYENPFSGFSDYKHTGKVRNRLKIQYEINDHELYFGSELFLRTVYYKKAKFNGLRLTIGDKIESKIGEFNYGLGYERELNVDYPLNFFYLKLDYTINLGND